MSEQKKDNSRRKFLSLGLLGGAALVAGKAAAQDEGDTDEKVKMLTPDGQLVEVDKSLVEKAPDKQKANNKKILNWTKSIR